MLILRSAHFSRGQTSVFNKKRAGVSAELEKRPHPGGDRRIDLTETVPAPSTVTPALGRGCFELKCSSEMRADQIVRCQLFFCPVKAISTIRPPANDLLLQKVRSFGVT